MLGCTGCLPSAASEPVRFTPSERAMILSHGPWPQQQGRDPSNRFSGNGAAIRFGRALFSDARLSAGGDMSCATCHRPDRAMTDGLPRARGEALLDRNTPPIANLADRRWYGWTGQADTLWGQSIRPLVNPMEMAAGPELLARRVIFSPDLARSYRRIVGRPPSAESPESILVNIGKMLSAWQETLVTPATPFDRFRDALARGEDVPADQFSASARRGLKFFVGEGRCSLCHFGPGFSNDEFHHIGLLHFVDGDRVDPGRHGGLDRYLRSPYTRAGPHSDEPPEAPPGHPEISSPVTRTTGAASGCRRCAMSPPPRRTCTTVRWPIWPRWWGTTTKSTWNVSMPPVKRCCGPWGLMRPGSGTWWTSCGP
ncbi:MAG: hypothetical protein F4206_08615 [Gammaproteobacteria bacterium]|nr:hypothetical protein [Gammaproteobacteria bacterium]